MKSIFEPIESINTKLSRPPLSWRFNAFNKKKTQKTLSKIAIVTSICGPFIFCVFGANFWSIVIFWLRNSMQLNELTIRALDNSVPSYYSTFPRDYYFIQQFNVAVFFVCYVLYIFIYFFTSTTQYHFRQIIISIRYSNQEQFFLCCSFFW